MDKIKEWVSTHKETIITILTLLISFFTALLAMGKEVAIFATVMVAIIQVIIYFLKEGLNDKFFELSVATIKLIVDVINGTYTETHMVEIAGSAKDGAKPKKKKVVKCILTEDMIREILKKGDEDNAEE